MAHDKRVVQFVDAVIPDLGRIFEEQNENAGAIEHYERFLNLWKDADPGLPEVEDAKKRLTGLKN